MLGLLSSMALAGSVYVNGVNVDSLRDQTFDNVTVTIDARGDVHIKAPQYQIEVVGKQPPAAPPPPVAPAVTPSVRPGPPPVQPVQPATPPAAGGIAKGAYWLVSEDAGSRGHAIDVWVNGTKVQTVRSGEAQKIVDLSPWLHKGDNAIRVESSSNGAGGGPLYVYIGTGDNDSGTVVLNTPEVQYGLGASRNGPASKDYTLKVP